MSDVTGPQSSITYEEYELSEDDDYLCEHKL